MAVLDGEYDDRIEKFVIMDCRFDYEFEGGHIQGAINMSPQKLFDYFTDIFFIDIFFFLPLGHIHSMGRGYPLYGDSLLIRKI